MNNEVKRPRDFQLEPDWTPTCAQCCVPFPGYELPIDSEWICPTCVCDREVMRQIPNLPPSWRDELLNVHWERFSEVSDRYPRRVLQAYLGEPARALCDSDEQVFATVAAWEHAQGLVIRGWQAVASDSRENGRAAVPDNRESADDVPF
jgi:hypothetical protein